LRKKVIFVDSAAHEWLFPYCSCIVHHVGSGTTAASVRSGKPTIITPVQGDQFDFAASVQTIGCGIGLGHLSTLTPATLGMPLANA
jgi:sterol 3beta-glucosyltransferase